MHNTYSIISSCQLETTLYSMFIATNYVQIAALDIEIIQ